MLSKKNFPCPVCGSISNKVLYEPWVDIHDPSKLYGAASGIPGTQRLVVCNDCGMIYENPRFPDDVILQAYISSQESEHDSQYEIRVNSFYRTLKSLGNKIPAKGSKVLDIGTAGGAFLDAAGRFGYDAVGLEPSLFLVEKGQERGLNIAHGTIDDHPFEPASFDMVCLWDVIEHLTDPKGALLKIMPAIKDGGLLIINYPDIGTGMAKIAGRRFWWILSVHLHYFTRDTITKICGQTGFRVFHFQRYWQTLQFGYLEDMAIHYKIPMSKFLKKITPEFIQKIPISYYASQTTALARMEYS